MVKNVMKLLLLCAMVSVCLAQEAVTPTVTSIPVSYGYQARYDLDYSQKSVGFIASDLREKYGIGLGVGMDAMDVCVELEKTETKTIDEVIVTCFLPGDGYWQNEEKENETLLGMVGKKEAVHKVIEKLKSMKLVKNVIEHKEYFIDLKGKQISIGEAIGKIAQLSHLGFETDSLDFSAENPKIEAFGSAGPFAIYVSKEPKTNRMIINFAFREGEWNPMGTDNEFVESVILCTDKQSKPIQGKNTLYGGRIPVWISDEPVWFQNKTMIKGTIKCFVLRGRYIIQGIQKDTHLSTDNFSIQVKKYDVQRYFCLINGSNSLPSDEEIKRCMVVHIEPKPGLSDSDKAFIQQCFKEYHAKPRTLSRQSFETYLSIQKNTPYIEQKNVWSCRDNENTILVNLKELKEFSAEQLEYLLENDADSGFTRDIFTEIFINPIRDNREVFPIGMELLKYEPAELEFSLSCLDDEIGDVSKTKQDSKTARQNSIGMELVWIPAGQFMMGSSPSAPDTARKYGGNEAQYTSEHPQHPVTISKGFWMSRYEVTQYQYKMIMGKNPSQFKYKCEHCDKFIPGNILREDFLTEDTYTYPVETVTYNEAVEFCKKLSQKEGETYFVPTEAQWEYACRAGSNTGYYFGNDSNSLGDYAWYRKNADESTHPVGQKKPNAWGLYDMYGNAEEWCLDGYQSDYYSRSPQIDPYNNDCKTGKYFVRVCRGGCFFSRDKVCRSAFRSGDVVGSEDESASYTNPMIGFRVICVSKE